MSEQSKTKIPAPLYAAAGAGDLAYQQLRKLPGVVSELTGKAATGGAELRERTFGLRERGVELREKAATSGAELRVKARDRAVTTLRVANSTATELRERAAATDLDLDRLRAAARRNAETFVTRAHAAQEKAAAVYGDLVARGAQVIGGTAGTVAADAELEAGTAPAALPAGAEADSKVGAKTGNEAGVEAGAEAGVEAKSPAKATKATKRTRPATK
jgi:heparin binding hemagglutinin HbhA